MSAFDNLKNKAAELAEDAKEHLETATDAIIDKAGDAVDAVTGGKFSDKVDDVQAQADDAVGDDDTLTTPTPLYTPPSTNTPPTTGI